MTTNVQGNGMGPGQHWRVIGWGAAASLLLIPLIAMQLSREWNWTALDFVFAAVMIGGTGLMVELALRLSRHWAYRTGFALVLIPSFLTVWVNAAVGIVGETDDPRNLAFGAVLVTGVVIGVATRFTARGMMFAALAAAMVQAAAGIANWSVEPIAAAMSGVFVLLWLAAAALFAKAAG